MPPPRPCWPALFLMCREVGYLHCLVGPASLDDWRCSCLCSELIPSVTEKLVIFIKELLFPQTAPTRTGLECVGVVGPDLGYWRAGLYVARPSGLK